jgi:uncharacterized protein (TIGR02145 family)
VSGAGNFDANGQIVSAHAAYGKFIKQYEDAGDWRSPKNDMLWSSGSEASPVKTVNDPCPDGWRIPTNAELGKLAEKKLNWDPDKRGWYFGSAEEKILLRVAGYRRNIDGTVTDVGISGNYWSSSVNGIKAYELTYSKFSVQTNQSDKRAYGQSVRCVADH